MQPRNARDAGDSPAKPVVVVMVDGCGSPLAGSAHHDGRADGIGVDEEAEHENAGEGPGDGKNACGCMREMEKIMRPASPRWPPPSPCCCSAAAWSHADPSTVL